MSTTEHSLSQHYCYVSCPLCGANDAKTRFPATRNYSQTSAQHFCCTNSYLAQHGDIVECQRCGMVYNNPQLDPDRLLAAYRQVVDPRYVQEKQGRKYTFRRSLRQLHRFHQPPGKLLDIGCYTGTFMEVAAAEGWEVYGFELSSWAAEIARNHGAGPVYDGQLEHIPHPSGHFDVITCWDVLEHVSNPLKVLHHTSALLKTGGLLALSTYLIDSYPVRILGTRYPFFMEMHLVHFSKKTLHCLLSTCGYEILRIAPHHRVIAVTYFLEKLKNLLPLGNYIIQPFLKRTQGWLQKKFVRVGFTGLSNIFARYTGRGKT